MIAGIMSPIVLAKGNPNRMGANAHLLSTVIGLLRRQHLLREPIPVEAWFAAEQEED